VRTPGSSTAAPPGRTAVRRVQWIAVSATLLAGTAQAGPFDGPFSFGGNLAYTTDYIYRGLSESNDEGAVQGDVHVNKGEAFAGVWASTRDSNLIPYANSDLEVYLGRRFDLGSEWSASVSARSHYYLDAGGLPDDYQEVSASIAWLDRWTFSLSAIPNSVRWYGFTYDDTYHYMRLGRAPAWVVETSAQWLIYAGLFVTAGAGYYYAGSVGNEAGAGYVYANGGLAYEYRQWRVELGYFFAQNEAQQVFPYPPPSRHIAGTVSWRF
jgi:uncharacterized protein (TIGR02001 family)